MEAKTQIKWKNRTLLKNSKFHTNNSKKSSSTEGIKGKDPLIFKILLLAYCRLQNSLKEIKNLITHKIIHLEMMNKIKKLLFKM